MHPDSASRPALSHDAHAILESITDAFYSLDAEWRFTYVNHHGAALLGMTREALLGQVVWDLFPGLRGSDFEALYCATVRDRVAGSATAFYPDHDRWYEVHAYPADGGISVYFRNVTERMKADEAIRESELRFRLMADSIPQIVWITDGAGRVLFFNRQWRTYAGELAGATTHEGVASSFVHPDDHAATMAAWDTAAREGRNFEVEHRIRAVTGEYRWFLVRAEPYRDARTGEIVRWYGTSTDIHDARLAAAALSKSEERYRFLFESIDEGFCIIEMLFDQDGKPRDYRFCEANPTFEQQTGMRNAIGRTARELAPELEPYWFETYGKVALTGQPIRFENEARALGRWFDVYAFRIDEPQANKVAILFKDITGSQQMKQELAAKIRSLEQAERRQAFQLAVADRVRVLATPDEVTAAASELLGRHLGGTRVGYGEVDEAGTILRVRRDWTDGTLESMTGWAIRLDDFGPDIVAELRAGRILALEDIGADRRAAPYAQAYQAIRVCAALAVPLMKAGRLRALLHVHSPTARRWHPHEALLVQDTMERIWAAVERASAEEQRQRVEERLRRIAERQAFQLEVADLLRGLSDIAAIHSRTSALLCRYFRVSRVLFCNYDIRQRTVVFHSCRTDGSVPVLGGTFAAARFGTDNLPALEDGKPWVCEDIARDPRTCAQDVRAAFESLQIASAVMMPLSRDEARTAYLFLNASQPRHWTDEDLATIGDVAERVSIAVERERARQEQAQAEAKLKDADRRKDEFLAMLAHELRNPLAPIGAAAQLLKLARPDEARLRQTSDIISRQVGHMTSLVDDLLDVSRVTRGLVKLDRAPLDMRQVVSEALEQTAPLIQARRHRLHLQLAPGPAMVQGDAKRLAQVVTNLLNNAAKYTPEGGNISLATVVHDTELELSVSDDGIGMEPSLVARVFDLFSQAERSSDRSLGGLGLGLALVRSLVELHGGQVSCASDGPGKGSRFTVCLPRLADARPLADAGAAAALPAGAHKPMRMMVVDDNVDAAQMLALYLEAAGHEVRVDHEPVRALERARAFVPEVCLLDIGLPGMDGNELARRLRAQPETAGAVLIAVTGYGQQQDRRTALEAGFSHYLVKPVDTAVLSGLLDDVAAGRTRPPGAS